ncbi:YlmH family RNA-binding protein [Kurthia sibirica]|uniref:YlmH family RNA-binding protein n=1 Tax=Kurthia sibirica TaxID=202750 RepID=UPI0031FDE988
MKKLDNILQHFRPEEQEFITQVTDWIDDVTAMYTAKLTGFLDPRQVMIMQSIIGQNNDVKMQAEGLMPDAERQRVLIYPDYLVPQFDDFNIICYEMKYPSKFVQLHHPDVLGSLVALGLDRSKFGDIRLNERKIQFVAQKEVSNFIEMNLTAINKVKVHLSVISPTAELIVNDDVWIEQSETISSLRIDTVIAAAYSISRQKAAMLIQGGKVKVNYRLQESVSFEVDEGDLLSIRGQGRLAINVIAGRTKKDKIRVILSKLERKS